MCETAVVPLYRDEGPEFNVYYWEGEEVCRCLRGRRGPLGWQLGSVPAADATAITFDLLVTSD
jgi:hypothetical protein